MQMTPSFAGDTSITILRDEPSLRAAVRYINHFQKISGLGANLDKTKVIPFGKFFDPKTTICDDIPLVWEATLTLLGLEIDNKFKNLKTNFDRVHLQTATLINDWKNCYLPIEGRIAISKCLLVS